MWIAAQFRLFQIGDFDALRGSHSECAAASASPMRTTRVRVERFAAVAPTHDSPLQQPAAPPQSIVCEDHCEYSDRLARSVPMRTATL